METEKKVKRERKEGISILGPIYDLNHLSELFVLDHSLLLRLSQTGQLIRKVTYCQVW
jgi:hypothetical protein